MTRAEEKPKHNPDDDLSILQLVMKYQLAFTKRFGPDYAYGVHDLTAHLSKDCLEVEARVRPAHQSSKGRIARFHVPMDKFRVWRNNINLYSFISEPKTKC